MANKKIGLGILIMVLVFGLAFIGCETEGSDDGGSIASELIGTWELEQYPESFTLEISANSITHGGTVGKQAGAYYESLVPAGSTWRAGNGKIELGSQDDWYIVYFYEIDGDELTLEVAIGTGAGSDVLVLVKK